jgi:hypothetical protein
MSKKCNKCITGRATDRVEYAKENLRREWWCPDCVMEHLCNDDDILCSYYGKSRWVIFGTTAEFGFTKDTKSFCPITSQAN